ncbi:MAG: hypothetical protein O2851_00750 [Proteobacteria bacterium]|nr:hypothetical protein [Pseudomonadota bacterium]
MLGSSIGTQAEITRCVWRALGGSEVRSDRPPPAGINFKISVPENQQLQTFPFDIDLVASDDSINETSLGLQGVDLTATYCLRAQADLKVLKTQMLIRVRKTEGSYRFLTPEEQKAQLERTEQRIFQYCG